MISLSALIHAPAPCFISTTQRPTSSPDPTTVRSSSMAASARIAVVGDVVGFGSLKLAFFIWILALGTLTFN